MTPPRIPGAGRGDRGVATRPSLPRLSRYRSARTADTIVAVVLLDLAMIVAASLFWPIHMSAAVIVAAGVALAAGTLIAVLGARFRWNSAIVAGSTVLAFLVLGVPAAVPGQALLGVIPTVPGLADLIAGAALSWKELLTISLPVGSYEALLVPVFLLVLVLSVVSLTVALRARWGELAALGPAVLFVAAILLGPASATLPLITSLTLLSLLLVYLVFRRSRRRGEAIRLLNEQSGTTVEARVDRRIAAVRTAVGAAVILALAAGGSVAASALVPPTGSRDVLRSAIKKPFDPRDYPSPLSAFRRFHDTDTASATILTVDGLEAGERVRLATLDSYDGVVYTVGSASVSSASGTFSLVPFDLDRSGDEGRRAEVTIQVGDYSGVWVPDVGALESIRFEGARANELTSTFYYNDNSGTAASLAGIAPGDSYTLEAVIPTALGDEEIAELEPGRIAVPEPAVIPDGLDAALASYTDGAGSVGEKLVAAIDGLRTNGYVSHGGPDEPFSRSGHSAGRITQLLTDQPMLGDAEQYAVTAALMARQLGFPARVVVGFASPDDASGTLDLTGADMTAWIEVAAAGAGWVAIDPNPPVREVPEPQPDDATKVARPQSVVQPPPDERIEPDQIVPPDVQENEQDAPLPAWLAILLAVLQVLLWIVIVLAVLLAPFAAIVGAKWQRRRRRDRAADPLERIRGGWDEFADAAADHGYEPPDSATRYEVAMAVGGRQPLVLAAAVDRATFGPSLPVDADADRVWRSAGELRGSMGAGRSRWEKIKALVSTRSFTRNRRRRQRKGEST
ncbi:transglutaminase-like domain-containing protein [Amnibacterium flavum]|uniref:Transglutaminase-like domain-containing protein n=1 Tax=Amnibacterium flavum TaxID=2173173 RepID=A0A2V1HZ49_9MICO|nr:transglutaminase-like domain-containing protein [Amnibacterium flavum]PVZ96237.1 hypothetical protein DDQ50_07430 [Amnibacterium flavum]